MNKFVQLLSSEHSKTINNLAIFVYVGFKVFLSIKLELLYIVSAHIVYTALNYVFAHRPMGLCWEKTLSIYERH